ncbi:DUF2255 family protein [Streptomyces sp. PT12]|uniref:DUF2255 family protein n=1 Tax=Streptomyces sp. PT12 TaxID=1510197 RepID=UPI000DE1ED3D|nr:DUF2255 family protein [Streptomyces sp. PT12]RBM12154.1 DUF2255 domain-containing protein [Streptomyces sp. PT12]
MTPEFAAVKDYLGTANTIRIATPLASGGERETPIWSVTVDDVPYVRSAYGEGSHWYRRATRAGRATIVSDRGRHPVAVTRVDDEATRAAVDDAYRAKYAREASSLQPLLGETSRVTTLRIGEA